MQTCWDYRRKKKQLEEERISDWAGPDQGDLKLLQGSRRSRDKVRVPFCLRSFTLRNPWDIRRALDILFRKFVFDCLSWFARGKSRFRTFRQAPSGRLSTLESRRTRLRFSFF